MRIPNPFNRKSSLDRFFDALDDSLGAAADLTLERAAPHRLGQGQGRPDRRGRLRRASPPPAPASPRSGAASKARSGGS